MESASGMMLLEGSRRQIDEKGDSEKHVGCCVSKMSSCRKGSRLTLSIFTEQH